MSSSIAVGHPERLIWELQIAGTGTPDVLAHRPLRTARVARQHSLGDFSVITQLLTQPRSSRIRLYLQPQQMNLHRRQNARPLRLAAGLRQRVVKVASLVAM